MRGRVFIFYLLSSYRLPIPIPFKTSLTQRFPIANQQLQIGNYNLAVLDLHSNEFL